MGYVVDSPQYFPGTAAEQDANRSTHNFVYDDEDGGRCLDCDCRPLGRVATWPCGTRDIPREKIQVGG